MCKLCNTEAELEDCAFDADEHHPDQWTEEKPTDSNDRKYNPYQGSLSPTEGRCNATLTAWDDRYGEVRYCMGLPMSMFVDDGSPFCKRHKHREGLMERASELFTHGVYSKTIRHVFEHLDPWQKLTTLGWYDSYVQESIYDFDPQLQEYTIDFSDYDDALPLEIETKLDSESSLSVTIPIPQEHQARGFALYRAAISKMKASLGERAVLDDSDGTGAMERETVVSVTDDGRKITDVDEHHLNIPISRTDDTREDLLAIGGVPTTADADDSSGGIEVDSLVMSLEDTSQTTGTANPVEQEMLDTDDDDLDLTGSEESDSV